MADEIKDFIDKIFNEGIEIKIENATINIEVVIKLLGLYYWRN